MDNLGIVSIAVGNKAKEVNTKLLKSLEVLELYKKNVLTLDIENLYGTLESNNYCHLNNKQLSRIIKTNLIKLIPTNWQYCIYLDTDTQILSKDILVIYDMLKDGYDLVITPSQHQDYWHIEQKEQDETFDYLGYQPIQLQGGMFGFSVNDRIKNFFLQWSNNYQLYLEEDQCSLVKSIHETNLKVWCIGYPFNASNGSVVKHSFGETRNGRK